MCQGRDISYGELVFNGYRGSVWENEKVLAVMMIAQYVNVLGNVHLKLVNMINLMLHIVYHNFYSEKNLSQHWKMLTGHKHVKSILDSNTYQTLLMSPSSFITAIMHQNKPLSLYILAINSKLIGQVWAHSSFPAPWKGVMFKSGQVI